MCEMTGDRLKEIGQEIQTALAKHDPRTGYCPGYCLCVEAKDLWDYTLLLQGRLDRLETQARDLVRALKAG